MALSDKINSIANKLKSLSKRQAVQSQLQKSNWFNVAKSNIQTGIRDVMVVFQEGNFVLFLKQFIILLVAFLLVHYGSKNLRAQRAKIADEISKLEIEQLHKDEYLTNKDYLLQLEPLFPDVGNKKEWMLVRLNQIFEKHNIPVSMEGNAQEKSEKMYTVGVQPVSFKASYRELGKLMSDIENGDDFLRVTEMNILKQVEKENLGKHAISIRFGTVFPQHKYAPTLFKDYAKQMERLKNQQTSNTGGRAA